ncbi:MAG: hypothetical protein V7607_1877 [Solirubrobacteraceae bacterium]
MPDLGDLPALDVALGLAFLYFLLSTVCSAINEGIASALGWRAKTLEDAIGNLLAHGEWKHDGQAKDLASEVFDHWRIRALVRDPDSSIRRRNKPSYMPPRAFSLAVAETLAAGPKGPGPGDSPWELADADILERVRTGLRSLPEGQARALVSKAVVNADGTLEGFRRQVETGFDDSMERASGWYKRKVQFTVAMLAAAVTLGLNVDSLQIGSRMWSDKPVRTAVAAKAGVAGDAQKAADAVESINQLKLPLGWGSNNAPKSVGAGLRRIPGWLITIAALSLGAPFWFDLLSRVSRLRGSGVPKEPRSQSDDATPSRKDR